MVIYSGFSTRRQEERYNQLLKDLLHLLSQMIITYIESAKACSFRQAYEKLHAEFARMDQHKYSDIKVSLEIEPLTQHVLNDDFLRETFSEPPKRRNEGKAVFRMKRPGVDHLAAKTVELSSQQQDRRRSFSNNSNNSSKTMSRYEGEEGSRELTMEDLMRLNPTIERKMSGYRKKRYLQQRNNFPQIKEEDYEGEEKD